MLRASRSGCYMALLSEEQTELFGGPPGFLFNYKKFSIRENTSKEDFIMEYAI